MSTGRRIRVSMHNLAEQHKQFNALRSSFGVRVAVPSPVDA